MGDINEVIGVEVKGLGDIGALADALDKAAVSGGRLRESLAGIGGAGGADKIAAGMDAAAAKIAEAADKAAASMERIGTSAESAAGGVGRLGKAAAGAGGSLSDAAAGADAAAMASDRLAESAAAAGASLERQAVAGGRAGKSGAEAAAGGTKFWKGLGAVMLGAGVAAAYGIDKAMKFQAQMLLLHTQAGVSVGDTKKMSQGALLISAQTGQSLSDVAESAYHVASNMASMGTTVPKQLDAVRTAAEGAAVGHANMVDVTNALTAAIASGIPGVKNYDSAMGMLNATVGSGDMSMQDLSEAFGTGMVASVKGYGLSLKDVGAGLAVFGDNNIRGAKAGTDMRMAVQSLAVPAASAKKELASLGLTQHSLAKDMQSGGLLKALDDLNGRFKAHGITAKNEGQVITDLFGKKAGVGLSLLLEQMDRLQSKYPAITQGANGFTKAWQATQQSPAQKWKEAVAGLQASATGFGTELLPAFSTAVGWADKLLAAINGSKSGAKDIALAFGGMAALFTAKKLTSGVESAFHTAQSALRFTGKVAEVLKIPGLDKLANIGQGGAAAGMQRAGDTMAEAAGAMQRAADTMAGAADEEGVASRSRGVPGAGGKVPGVTAALPYIGQGLIIGAVIKAIGDMISPAGSQAGKYSRAFQQSAAQGPNPASQLHPYVFGGYEGWLTQHIGLPAGRFINSAFSQKPPPPPPAVVSSGAPSAAYAGRFGPSSGGYGVMPRVKVTPPDTSALDVASAKVARTMVAIGRAGSGVKPAKIPAPDTSALDVAKAKVTHDMAALGQSVTKGMKPAKIPAPDTSAIDTAKAKVGQQAAAIHANLQTQLSKKAKMAPPDLSAAQAAVGQARSTGLAIAEGLAGGIRAGIPDISAAAAAASAAAAVSMAHTAQTHSPSRVTYKIGEDTGKGFEHGLLSRVHHVKHAAHHVATAAVHQLSASAAASLRTGLLGGQSAVDAVMTALGKGPRPQDIQAIDQNTVKLVSQVPKGHSALVAMLKADNATLDRLAARRAVLMAEITDAQQITTSAISSASIVTAASGSYAPALAASNGPIAASQTIQGLQYMAGDQSQFAGQIAQLKKAGLNATSLDQLTQAGAQQGIPIAMGLLQGGPGAIKQVNQLEKSVIGSAGKLGNAGGPAMYQAGVDAGNAAARGLKSQLGTVESVMSQIAGKMVGALQSVLGHSAASKKKAATSASAATGTAASSGAGAGGSSSLHIPSLDRLTQMSNAAATALGRVASAADRAAPGIRHGGPQHGGHSGSVTYVTNVTVHLTVQGSVTSENDLVAVVQRSLLRRGSQNWQAGIVLPGRAV